MTSSNEVILGSPTEYGFYLPKLRYRLSSKYFPNNRISLLDYGCGNGANTILFTRDFQQVYGIEVEELRLKEAVSHVSSRQIPNLTYQLYEGATLPFNDQSFDCVISFEVLEHTQDDKSAIDDIYRVLKPGGRAIITVPNKWYLMETHGMNWPLENVIPWNRVPLLSWLPDSIHSRYAKARIYTKNAIVKKLKSAGFSFKYHQYLMPPFDKIKNNLIKTPLKSIYSFIEKTPLQAIGVAHFIVVEKE